MLEGAILRPLAEPPPLRPRHNMRGRRARRGCMRTSAYDGTVKGPGSYLDTLPLVRVVVVKPPLDHLPSFVTLRPFKVIRVVHAAILHTVGSREMGLCRHDTRTHSAPSVETPRRIRFVTVATLKSNSSGWQTISRGTIHEPQRCGRRGTHLNVTGHPVLQLRVQTFVVVHGADAL